MRSSADALSQTVLADKAAIESARAQIVASKAAVETAAVQMSYTTIHSPIDGRTGSIAVKQGNVVAANTSDLMTITEVQPIYVTFSVPEAQLGDIKRYMGQGELKVQAAPQADATNQESGVLTFIDNSVDATTGTIKLKGTFQNAANRLWPGEFVRVTLGLDHAAPCHRGSQSSRADRAGRPVRVRGEAGSHGRDAPGGHWHSRGSGIGD